MLPAKADLRRAHMLARRTRTGVARQAARMRALLCPFLRAGVTTAMRRKAGERTRILFFAAPASVGFRKVVLGQVATRTSPLPRRWDVAAFCLSLRRRGPFVCRPLLHAGQMKDRPACVAGPDFRIAPDLARADGALVVAIVDVFVCSSGNVWSLRFRHSPFLLARLLFLLWRSIRSCGCSWLARYKGRRIRL